jgi:hypothetical protein
MFGVSRGLSVNGLPKVVLKKKPTVDIKDGDGTSDPEKFIGTVTTPTTHGAGAPQKYMAVVKDAGGTFKWSCTGNATISGSDADAVVEIQGNTVSPAVDDTTLTVTYALDGVSQIATVEITVVSLEIEVATNAPNDSIVQLRSVHPPHQPTVGGTVRLMGPQLRVVIVNPDGRLAFPDPGNKLLDFEMAGDKSFQNFDISGQLVSANVGDAVMEARAGSVNGPIIATKTMTVFSFDPALLQVVQGSDYAIIDDEAAPDLLVKRYKPTGVGVTMMAQAAITPTGLDCSVDQIASLRITIVQQVEDFGGVVTRYGLPQVMPDAAALAELAAAGVTQVHATAPSLVRVTATFDPSVSVPVRDGTAGTPLYSTKPEAKALPMNCPGGGIATATDSPSHLVDVTGLTGTLVAVGNAVAVGKVRYSFLNTTRIQRFKTFLVAWIQGTEVVTAVREALWELNLDSAQQGQHASVQADAAASVDPVTTGVPANDAKKFSNTEWLDYFIVEL